jgi:hypothetical protein
MLGKTLDLSMPPEVIRNMANSYRPNILYRPLCGVPSQTPGPHGHNDQGDPNVYSSFGDTPGPLGINDYATPLPSPSLLNLLQHNKICVDSQNSNIADYVIPLPNTIAPPLISDSDIAEAATLLGVEQAAIYAVSKVESGGRTGFDSKGRPKVLFEALWFHKFTGGKFDTRYPHLSQATWSGAKLYYDSDQWVRLSEAFALDAESALKSASWGKFQVMGFNHNGFPNVFRFCDAMFKSEREHLRSFLAYCQDNHLVRHLKSKNWAEFAKGYNGDGYKHNKYDEKLKIAYESYLKRSENTKK